MYDVERIAKSCRAENLREFYPELVVEANCVAEIETLPVKAQLSHVIDDVISIDAHVVPREKIVSVGESNCLHVFQPATVRVHNQRTQR